MISIRVSKFQVQFFVFPLSHNQLPPSRATSFSPEHFFLSPTTYWQVYNARLKSQHRPQTGEKDPDFFVKLAFGFLVLVSGTTVFSLRQPIRSLHFVLESLHRTTRSIHDSLTAPQGESCIKTNDLGTRPAHGFFQAQFDKRHNFES